MRQILNYHDAVLYDTDLDLFQGSNWLNDNCINFYLRLLQCSRPPNKRNKCSLGICAMQALAVRADGRRARDAVRGPHGDQLRAVAV